MRHRLINDQDKYMRVVIAECASVYLFTCFDLHTGAVIAIWYFSLYFFGCDGIILLFQFRNKEREQRNHR